MRSPIVQLTGPMKIFYLKVFNNLRKHYFGANKKLFELVF